MIAESSFATIFGAAVPGGEDSLVHLARAAVRAGFAIIPCWPGTKRPMCTLPAREVKRADDAAKEAARQAGRRRWDIAAHECGVKHAITDDKESDRVIRRLVKAHGPINLGVELGRSRVIVVDVDTDAEKAGFERSWLEQTGGQLPHQMTVASPGVQDEADGSWKHKNGGHYWFRLPEGLTLPDSDGAMKHESGWIAMWANRQVLVPPSVRREGPYRLLGDIHPAPMWLLSQIVDFIMERTRRAAEQQARRAANPGGEEAHIDTWSTGTPWADILEPDGWFATGLPDTCGCEIWTAPGVHASPKSATAHDVGCALYDDSPGHAPLHVWTDNPPDFLFGQNKTVTKIQYIALRDHAGSIPLACRAEGIAREEAPLVPLPGVPTHLGGPMAPATGVAGLQSPIPFARPMPPDVNGQLLGISGPIADAPARAAATIDALWNHPATQAAVAQVPPLPDPEPYPVCQHGVSQAASCPACLPSELAAWNSMQAEVTASFGTPPTLQPLPPPSPGASTAQPAPPNLGIQPLAPPPGVVDDPFERLVRSELQRRVVAAEADRRHTEIRFPFAHKIGQRGFQPMREVLKEALETPPEYLVDRVLRKGSYGVLGAQYKAGKTWLAGDLSLSIASGRPWLGLIPVQTGRAAIMHNEGDKVEFAERLRAIAANRNVELTDDVLDRLMLQEGASKLDQPEAVNRLYENLEQFRPDLVVIDPWYLSAGEDADGKTLSKMGTVLGNLQGVAQELGTALLITAHWNKSGDGKGVERWSGSGLAEWGRVLINVAIDKLIPAAPYAEDKTGKTVVDLHVSITGQTTGSYWVHREVWRDDAADLTTPMRYLVVAREQEDPASAKSDVLKDTTKSMRETLLEIFVANTEGMSKTKAIETAKGGRGKGGRALAVWREAFDELLREELIRDVGDILVTGTDGQEKSVPGVKYAITEGGRTALASLSVARATGDTSRFTQLVPLATTEQPKET